MAPESEDLDNRVRSREPEPGETRENGDRSEERALGVVEDNDTASDDSSALLDHSKRRATLDAVRARLDRSAAFIPSVVLDAKSAGRELAFGDEASRLTISRTATRCPRR